MSELKNLPNAELNEKIKLLAGDERRLTKLIIEHIAEVDRRKLFLAMAYPSLFEYLTREIGYSSAAAQRRIDAARLLQHVPEVAAKIENGTINLAQISKLQQACRAARKEGRVIAVVEQRAMLEKLEGQGAEQTDLILACEFELPVLAKEKKHIQRDESVRVELTFSKDEMELLERAQEILSHKTGGRLKETVIAMAEKIVTNIEPRRPEAKISKSTSAAEVIPRQKSPLKSVTPRLRKEILSRDRCCQFVDKATGKMCGAKKFLEIDHIQPRFAQGSNAAKNLRVLCKNHNRYRYRAELGP